MNRLFVAIAIVSSFPAAVTRAQPVAIPNADFETAGKDANLPAGWSASGTGDATWNNGGRGGSRAISVRNEKADTALSWKADQIALQPQTLYRLSFWSRGDGTIIGGLDAANRDFIATSDWTRFHSVFCTPSQLQGTFLRLGQWDRGDQLWFDDIELAQLQPLFHRVESAGGPFELGSGESIAKSRYRFVAPLNYSNFSRPLHAATAGFNTDRWVFSNGAQVTYRHRIGVFSQSAAHVRVQIGHYRGGKLIIEASRDGSHWTRFGELDKSGTVEAELPAALLPTEDLWIRLRAIPSAGATNVDPVSIQVAGYSFEATVNGAPDSHGETRFLEESVVLPDKLQVRIETLGALRPGADNIARLKVRSTTPRTVESILSLQCKGKPAHRLTKSLTLRPGDNAVDLPYSLFSSGDYTVHLELREALPENSRTLYAMATDFRVSTLDNADYGSRIGDLNDVWWANAPYNISRERPLPPESATSTAVSLSAAGNESEPFQIVVCPARDVRGLQVVASELTGPGGARIDARNIGICEVAYVNIAQPTDSTGAVGAWPDPLPPHFKPIDLQSHRNQPFWITVRVPGDARAGIYSGVIQLISESWNRSVPVQLTVRAFSLSEETHVQSAFGLSPAQLSRYHNLTEKADVARIMEKYYENFAAHRISPYDPVFDAPIQVNWGLNAATASRGDGSGNQIPVTAEQVKLDFSAFDKAAQRAFDVHKFTTFRLPLQGMGWGTYQERGPGGIGNYAEGTPEYEILFASYVRQIQDHLEQKGWLDKAYVYWFDEPDPKDYQFVCDGMNRIRKYAPKLRRMLTEQPEEVLFGAANLWCPVTPEYKVSVAEERMRAGDEFWWYICCSPKAPYATEFIDHPATELRTWLWQTWQHDVRGILIWESVYWTSDAAYPNELQNPWQDPMSWVSGYSTASGNRMPWGNGDGRFLYPPNRDPNRDKAPNFDAPINSIRWEMLREGIEDYEYFWTLRDTLRRVRPLAKTAEQQALIARAEALLTVPDSVTRTLTDFSTEPTAMMAHREKLAAAIEALHQIAP